MSEPSSQKKRLDKVITNYFGDLVTRKSFTGAILGSCAMVGWIALAKANGSISMDPEFAKSFDQVVELAKPLAVMAALNHIPLPVKTATRLWKAASPHIERVANVILGAIKMSKGETQREASQHEEQYPPKMPHMPWHDSECWSGNDRQAQTEERRQSQGK